MHWKSKLQFIEVYRDMKLNYKTETPNSIKSCGTQSNDIKRNWTN